MKAILVLFLFCIDCAASGTFPSVCQMPIEKEKINCPKVRELRTWLADDGSQASCKLLVCNEIHQWHWQYGHWNKGF